VLGVALCREVDPIRVPEPTVIAPNRQGGRCAGDRGPTPAGRHGLVQRGVGGTHLVGQDRGQAGEDVVADRVNVGVADALD
jgi:hypothetical protein